MSTAATAAPQGHRHFVCPECGETTTQPAEPGESAPYCLHAGGRVKWRADAAGRWTQMVPALVFAGEPAASESENMPEQLERRARAAALKAGVEVGRKPFGDRGLGCYVELQDGYGAAVEIADSSAADEPAVWVRVEGGALAAIDPGNRGASHLNVEQALILWLGLGAAIAEISGDE